MPERILKLWDSEILLKPYFADFTGLDGTIGDHCFISHGAMFVNVRPPSRVTLKYGAKSSASWRSMEM